MACGDVVRLIGSDGGTGLHFARRLKRGGGMGECHNNSNCRSENPFRVSRCRLMSALVLLVGRGLPVDLIAPDVDLYPYGVQKAEVTVGRPDGSTFTAVVYYPVSDNKEGVPHARVIFPAPVISFGHGYLAPPEVCASTLERLACRGYIVIASRSGLELFPSHRLFAEDLRHCLTFMADQHANPDSIWYQQVNVEAFGLLGLSMGGGACILAAADDSRVKAVATMAAAETRPPASEAAGDVTVPVCFLIGTDDQIAPAEQHALKIYEAAGPQRLALLIEGGYHCGFADLNAPCICDQGSIERHDQLAVTCERLTAFFDLRLRNHPDAREQLLAASPAGSPNVIVLGEVADEAVNVIPVKELGPLAVAS